MKKLLLIVAVLSTSVLAYSQKYVKILYKDVSVESADLDFKVSDIVSTAAETKFKLKVINKTKDFFIFKPNEMKVTIDGKEYTPSEKDLLIEPYDADFRVINIKGTGFNAIKNFSVQIEGLQKAVAAEKIITAPDFKLPPANNEFTAGNFTCNMVDLKKESGNTWVKFDCRYNGDMVGIISTNKPSVLMPDGNLYATQKTKEKYTVLKKGDSKSVSMRWDRMEGGSKMDMQKVDMIIKWNETFTESKLTKVAAEKIEIEWDEALTNAKGK